MNIGVLVLCVLIITACYSLKIAMFPINENHYLRHSKPKEMAGGILTKE